MPQAIADPDHLEQFARQLAQFQQESQGRLALLRSQFGTVSQTWQDQEQRRFETLFGDLVATFARFIEGTEEYVPYLQKKAAHLREYQSP